MSNLKLMEKLIKYCNFGIGNIFMVPRNRNVQQKPPEMAV